MKYDRSIVAKTRILVIDDEVKILELVGTYLENAGFAFLRAENGRAGLELAQQHKPALIILDLMLPDISGEEVCRLLRRTSSAPILMLTAKVAEDSLVRGFNLGADDYMTKPFSPREVVVRVQALLRRAATGRTAGETNSLSEEIIVSDDGTLVLDPGACQIKKNGVVLALTATEFRLLAWLIKNPQHVFSREEIADHVLEQGSSVDLRTIDAHIKNLRHKLGGESDRSSQIRTVHGFGYSFGGTQI